MIGERFWVVLATTVACTMVAWGFDSDGRYLQQIALICAGLILGELLTNRGGEE